MAEQDLSMPDLDELDIDAAGLDALFRATASSVEEYPLCAAQVAVGRHGKLAATRAFGRARFGASERDATPESLFTIFSCTKAIVASAAWILMQEGKLTISDRVVETIPEFGRHGKDVVRVEQLLTHSAGFPNAEMDRSDWPDPARRIECLADWRLEWEPGSRFVYHGTSSMWVLAELITRLSGQDYRDFIRSRIFEPMGLTDIYIGLPESEFGRLADVILVGHSMTDEERAVSAVDAPVIGQELLEEANSAENRSIGSPAGGSMATAASLALFYQGLLGDASGHGPGIWRPQTLADAWTPREVDFVDDMTKQVALRGLGVAVAGEQGKIWRGFAETCSASAFGHMGAGGQVSWADPETGLSFVYCTNGAQRNPALQGFIGLQLSTLAVACAK